MSTATGSHPDGRREMTAAEAARTLVRRARKAALGTLEKGSGLPYVSLVTVATEPDGAPVLLVSRLAVHTQNMLADQRVSLLFDGSGPDGDPLAGGRVTLIGRIERTTSATARARFLARQPGAAVYADFADFGFLVLHPERAHYIGGFGRIVDLKASDLVLPIADAVALTSAEADILAHMNTDHAEALNLYATRLLGQPAGAWMTTGIDSYGLDLVNGEQAVRLWFPEAIKSPDEARRMLARLAKEARATGTA